MGFLAALLACGLIKTKEIIHDNSAEIKKAKLESEKRVEMMDKLWDDLYGTDWRNKS